MVRLSKVLGAIAILLVAGVMLLHTHRPKADAAVRVPVAAAPVTARAGATPMGDHMVMTELQPEQPGDKARAAVVEAAARRFAERYVDYRKAEQDGFAPVDPEIKQPSYHFVRTHGKTPPNEFNPDNPPTLIYQHTDPTRQDSGYKLVGVMYVAPADATLEQLNERIPLSVAHWHIHTNICQPPRDYKGKWMANDENFGFNGSIATEAACKAAGGTFIPDGRWMLHVYPFHKDESAIWNSGMSEEDDHHPTKPSTSTKMDPNMKM